LVQMERVGPEGLVAERPVAEDVAARQGDVSRRLRDPCCDGRTGAARVTVGVGRSAQPAMIAAVVTSESVARRISSLRGRDSSLRTAMLGGRRFWRNWIAVALDAV